LARSHWASRSAAAALCGWLLFIGSSSAAENGSARIAFARHGEPVATRDLAWLRGAVPVRTIRVHDPYEAREVEFQAFAFDAVLDAAYGDGWREEEELLFRCRDGYEPTVPVARILDHPARLAFARADRDAFTLRKRESGVLQQIALDPFYLVWENLDDEALRADGDYGWPYQVVGVELIRARDHFPKMVPPASASASAQAGFTAFRAQCSRCHAVNGEGGTVGPELNGPVPFVRLRDRDWLRRWIDDPAAVLPTARMPRVNPALPGREAMIDDVISYLEAMAAVRDTAAAEATNER
jgi:cytochrome c2